MTLAKVRNTHGTYLRNVTWLRSEEEKGFEKNKEIKKERIAQLNVFFQGRLNLMAADIQQEAYLPNQHLKACASYRAEWQI